jgi:hypothetical protein
MFRYRKSSPPASQVLSSTLLRAFSSFGIQFQTARGLSSRPSTRERKRLSASGEIPRMRPPLAQPRGSLHSAMPIRGVLPKLRVRWRDLAENCGRENGVSGRVLPPQHAKAAGAGGPGWVELPESAWSRKHPRDLSTRPLSLRSIVLAQDDSSRLFRFFPITR